MMRMVRTRRRQARSVGAERQEAGVRVLGVGKAGACARSDASGVFVWAERARVDRSKRAFHVSAPNGAWGRETEAGQK